MNANNPWCPDCGGPSARKGTYVAARTKIKWCYHNCYRCGHHWRNIYRPIRLKVKLKKPYTFRRVDKAKKQKVKKIPKPRKRSEPFIVQKEWLRYLG